MSKGISRRNFVRNSVLGLGAAGMVACGKEPREKEPRSESEGKEGKIKRYRTLGRTGFRVSDISLGFSNNAAVIKAALDTGINYIDTAESYGNQKVVGEAIAGRDRSAIFISSKMEIKKETGLDKQSFLNRFQKCQEELQTDYIDCMMVHMGETLEVLKTPGFHAAMEQMKKEGRLRFVGISNHGSSHPVPNQASMEYILTAAAEDGRFDVFLMAYNFLQANNGRKILELCRKKKIGTTIMKKNPVGIYHTIQQRIDQAKKEGREPNPYYVNSLERFRKKAELGRKFIEKYDLQDPGEIRDAAIRFVLSNPDAHTAVCSMRNFDHIRQFVNLSGSDLSVYDQKKLAAWEKGCGQLYCRHACGECESACPAGVPVNTIMRYHHYYDAQGREKYALKSYLNLDAPKPDLCRECPGYCEKACGYGVPIQGMLIMAHRRLSLV